MPTITLKDIPRSVHQALKSRAKMHGRSLNKEVLACLQAAVAPARIDVDAMLKDIRLLREATPGCLTDSMLREAKRAGRP